MVRCFPESSNVSLKFFLLMGLFHLLPIGSEVMLNLTPGPATKGVVDIEMMMAYRTFDGLCCGYVGFLPDS